MIAALSKKVREAVPGNLDKALAEVARLNEEFSAIKIRLSRRMKWDTFEDKRKIAAEVWAREPTPENLETLVLREIVLERVQEKLAGSYRGFQYGHATEKEFCQRFPTWREVLAKPVALRLLSAKAELERVTTKEKARLASEFDEDEIVEHSLPIRRAAEAVRHLELLSKQIASDELDVCWSRHVDEVLELANDD